MFLLVCVWQGHSQQEQQHRLFYNTHQSLLPKTHQAATEPEDYPCLYVWQTHRVESWFCTGYWNNCCCCAGLGDIQLGQVENDEHAIQEV